VPVTCTDDSVRRVFGCVCLRVCSCSTEGERLELSIPQTAESMPGPEIKRLGMGWARGVGLRVDSTAVF